MKVNWPTVSNLTKYQETSDFDGKLERFKSLNELDKTNKPAFTEVSSNDNFASMFMKFDSLNQSHFFRLIFLHSVNIM